MADIQELYRLLKELEDQLAACMKCGMCQAVCPLYAETGKETDVARGKIALLEFLASQMLRDPKGVKDRLDKCLLCGSCAANCPSGVKVLDIFLKARAIITGYQGLSRPKKIIFRGMLANPGFLNKLLSLAARFQGLFSRQASQTLGSSCARFKIPLLGNRHFVPLAQTPWHRLTPSLNTEPGSGKLKVAFFPGCLTDKIFPGLAKTAVKVFNHHQVGIFMPEGQACCGIPALASGDKETFIKLVTRNMALFSKQSFDYLVTPCATCTSTIKKVWPMLPEYFSRETNEAIQKLAGVTLDISAFLVDCLGAGPEQSRKARGKPVTYHDPCHLKKSLDVSEQPRQLIRSNPDYNLIEMIESDSCCGMGGSFNLAHYDLSRRIGKKKKQNIIDSRAETVATGCPACMLQIIDLLSQEGHDLEVKHTLEIYAEALDRE
ncbi:MAG: (Fe-S)-binding protein [Desulfohalobiaceae bacterium]|nr:(Fe-S)-binding protein [Desulfohalobiaceae bacterium]